MFHILWYFNSEYFIWTIVHLHKFSEPWQFAPFLPGLQQSPSLQFRLCTVDPRSCPQINMFKFLINTTTLSIFNGKLFEIILDFNTLPSALPSAVMTNNNHICWMFADGNHRQTVHSSLILIQKCYNYICLPNRIYTFVTLRPLILLIFPLHISPEMLKLLAHQRVARKLLINWFASRKLPWLELWWIFAF